MSVFLLAPCFKDYIWGGTNLRSVFGKQTGTEKTAESWELSCHPDGESTVKNGKYAGQTLSAVIKAEGKDILGKNCARFDRFPIIIKLLDAEKDLSIQVHPSDTAASREGDWGKTEMWYILSAEPGAKIINGVAADTDAESFRSAIATGKTDGIFNEIPVHAGECYFIPSGRVHAIGKGILLAEIQQNSNLTYRLYDYKRRDKDGNLRRLDIEKGVDAADLRFTEISSSPLPLSCDYFTVEKVGFREGVNPARSDSFVALTVIEGCGTVDGVAVRAGDSLFITATDEIPAVSGDFVALRTFIPPET